MKRLLQTTGLIFAMLLWANVGMAQDYTFSPAHEATGVSTSPMLTIEFDAPVTLVPNKTIYISNEDWSHSYYLSTGKTYTPPPPRPADPADRIIISGNTLTINLKNNLLSGDTEFSVFAEVGAIKVGGIDWNELVYDNPEGPIWSFTTAAAVEGPKIVSVTPANDSKDVSITPKLIVEFDRDIQIGTGGSFRLTSDAGDFGFSISNPNMSISGSTLTIIAAGLNYNTTYHVEIDLGFIVNYTGLSDATYWTFTTETKPPQWAENYPTITQSPTGFTFKGKSDLAGIYYFVVTGSLTPPSKEQIKAGKNSSGGYAYKSFNGDMIGNDEFSTNMDFTPELLKGNSYYLHALVASDDGKNGEVETRSIDRIPPSINDVSSYPINGYDLFPVKDNIRIVFSEKVFNHNGGVTELTSASFSLTKDGDTVAFNFAVSLDGTEITLTPQSPLSGNTEYTVVISPLSDEFFNIMSGSVTRTFSTDQLNVWTGDSSDSWTGVGNWDEAYVIGKSVLIQSGADHYPTINSDITVNNFTIEAGAVVTQNGGIITVLGDFDLLSSEATNASYLPKGGELEVQGETRVHQHIVPGKGLVNYVMASPTANTNNANIGTTYLVKYYDNPTNSWISINSSNMLPGKGYVVHSLNDLVFNGDINRSSYDVDLFRTNGPGYGWNFLGNPYTASINWANLDVNTEIIENSFWIWNPSQKIYGAFNQETGLGLELDGVIPSNHGFLVKLKVGKTEGSIKFNPDAIVANNISYLKSGKKEKPPYIKISAGNTQYKDMLAVAFVTDASVGVDKYDTEKFFGNGNPFQVYTVEGSMKLSINSLPETNNETTVGLGYRAAKAGTYSIQLNENYLEYYEVILTDTKENTSVDLLYDGSYTFKVDKQEINSSRFTLTFPSMVSTPIEKVAPETDLNIYSQNGDIIAELSSGSGERTYELVAVSGQVVKHGKLHSGVNNLGKQPSGLFIINTRNEKGTIVSKKLLVTR